VPTSKDSLKERLSRYRQIKLSVIGRKSGRTIAIPVWFVLEGEKLYLLPVQGSDTNKIREEGVRAWSTCTHTCDRSPYEAASEKD
jgi:hypothetical protein